MKQIILFIALIFSSIGFYKNYYINYTINDAIVGGFSYGLIAVFAISYLNIVFKWCLL